MCASTLFAPRASRVSCANGVVHVVKNYVFVYVDDAFLRISFYTCRLPIGAMRYTQQYFKLRPGVLCIILGQYQILLVLSLSRLYTVCGNIDLTAPESDHKIHFRKILALLHSIVMAFVAKCHNVRDHPPAHKSSISKHLQQRDAEMRMMCGGILYVFAIFCSLFVSCAVVVSRSPKFSLFD